jgi:hypothetical protein
VIPQGRRLAFIRIDHRALHALDRVVGHGVAVAQVLEQGRQGSQTVSDRRAAQGALGQVVTPGDHMGPGHGPELVGLLDASESHEVLQRGFVRPAGRLVGQVGEPLDFGRHVGQALELGCREQSAGGGKGHQGILVGHVTGLLSPGEARSGRAPCSALYS